MVTYDDEVNATHKQVIHLNCYSQLLRIAILSSQETLDRAQTETYLNQLLLLLEEGAEIQLVILAWEDVTPACRVSKGIYLIGFYGLQQLAGKAHKQYAFLREKSIQYILEKPATRVMKTLRLLGNAIQNVDFYTDLFIRIKDKSLMCKFIAEYQLPLSPEKHQEFIQLFWYGLKENASDDSSIAAVGVLLWLEERIVFDIEGIVHKCVEDNQYFKNLVTAMGVFENTIPFYRKVYDNVVEKFSERDTSEKFLPFLYMLEIHSIALPSETLFSLFGVLAQDTEKFSAYITNEEEKKHLVHFVKQVLKAKQTDLNETLKALVVLIEIGASAQAMQWIQNNALLKTNLPLEAQDITSAEFYYLVGDMLSKHKKNYSAAYHFKK